MDNDSIDLWIKSIPEDLRDKTNEIIEEFRNLELECGPETWGQSRDLFTRAIIIVSIRNIPWEVSLTELIGRWIDQVSDEKKVREEVEDIYFRLLAKEDTIDVNTSRMVLFKAVSEWNRENSKVYK